MADNFGPSLESYRRVDTPADLNLCPLAQTSYAWSLLTRERALFARACRRKRCVICAETKRRILIARITAAKPTKFITLSCRHEGTAQDQLKRITRANARLWQQLRRKYGDCEYVRILEWCKDGYPHLHLLARAPYLPQRDLSRRWAKLTGAVVVDIRKAHGRSTRYVAKYVSKHTADVDAWTRQTISASRGFWVEPDRLDDWIGWYHEPSSVFYRAQELAQDWTLTRLRPGVYWLNEREPGDDLPPELQPVAPETLL